MVGGTVVGLLGGIHYWWPKMWGRMYNEGWAKIAWAFNFVGFNVIFIPQFIMGSQGMPRRYHEYLDEFHTYHVISTVGSWIMGIGVLMMITTLLLSLRNGKIAPKNPWGSLGLEWQTSSPPDPHNFPSTPEITHGPYDYDTVIPEKA